MKSTENSLTVNSILNKAENLAELLLDVSNNEDMSGKDLIIVLAVAQRMIHDIIGNHNNVEYLLSAIQEAEATYRILKGLPESD